MEKLLAIKDLKFSFYESHGPLFSGLSWETTECPHHALTGRSGCGKSTLLRLLAGLERPTQGEIYFQGLKLGSAEAWPPPHKRGMGMVFQDFALFPHLTVSENIGYANPREIDPVPWLQRVDLTKRADAYPRQLSGGEQQRVALARALAAKPRCLLMDEPFSNLDPLMRQDLITSTYELLVELKTPSLIVTHQPQELIKAPLKFWEMKDGHINPLNLSQERWDQELTVQAEKDGRINLPEIKTPFPEGEKLKLSLQVGIKRN